jgi:hypothetical protein
MLYHRKTSQAIMTAVLFNPTKSACCPSIMVSGSVCCAENTSPSNHLLWQHLKLVSNETAYRNHKVEETSVVLMERIMSAEIVVPSQVSGNECCKAFPPLSELKVLPRSLNYPYSWLCYWSTILLRLLWTGNTITAGVRLSQWQYFWKWML